MTHPWLTWMFQATNMRKSRSVFNAVPRVLQSLYNELSGEEPRATMVGEEQWEWFHCFRFMDRPIFSLNILLNVHSLIIVVRLSYFSCTCRETNIVQTI